MMVPTPVLAQLDTVATDSLVPTLTSVTTPIHALMSLNQLVSTQWVASTVPVTTDGTRTTMASVITSTSVTPSSVAPTPCAKIHLAHSSVSATQATATVPNQPLTSSVRISTNVSLKHIHVMLMQMYQYNRQLCLYM